MTYASLEDIASEIVACTKCDLFRGRKNAVPGEGNPGAKLVIVGEAPGRNEDAMGRPFVGNAGKFLDRYLSLAGIDRKDIFITNAVKCRPPNNRKPTPFEIGQCRPYLIYQLKLVNPRLVLALGVSASSSLGMKFSHLDEIRGKLFDIKFDSLNITVYPTYHPSFPMRFPSKRETFLSDLKRVKEILGKEIRS